MGTEAEAPRLNPASPFFHEDRHANLAAVRDRAITICGAGALGGNVAEALARMGFGALTVIDRDRVEQRNLSTQPYSRAEVGSPKARALASGLFRAVQARVTPVVMELTETNAGDHLAPAALVVDALDNTAGRAAVSSACLEHGVACLHAGFSGDGVFGSGQWEPGYTVPRDAADDPCDYPLTRPFALALSALTVRSVVQWLLTGEQVDFDLTWADARVTTYARGAVTRPVG